MRKHSWRAAWIRCGAGARRRRDQPSLSFSVAPDPSQSGQTMLPVPLQAGQHCAPRGGSTSSSSWPSSAVPRPPHCGQPMDPLPLHRVHAGMSIPFFAGCHGHCCFMQMRSAPVERVVPNAPGASCPFDKPLDGLGASSLSRRLRVPSEIEGRTSRSTPVRCEVMRAVVDLSAPPVNHSGARFHPDRAGPPGAPTGPFSALPLYRSMFITVGLWLLPPHRLTRSQACSNASSFSTRKTTTPLPNSARKTRTKR